jgi:hypothetical protein
LHGFCHLFGTEGPDRCFFRVVVAGGGHENMEGFVPFLFSLHQPLPDAGFWGGLITATSREFERVVAEGPDAGFAAPEILASQSGRRPWVFVGVRKRK